MLNNTRARTASVWLGVAILCGGQPASAQEAQSPAQWLREGTLYANFRLRHEHVDEDNALLSADATTLRTLIGYETASLGGFGAHIEGEDVRALNEDYNSASNGLTQYSVVADPQGAEINQAYLSYDADNWRVRAGRQRMKFDNARFFGDVAWRQNQQTFDALSLMHNSAGHRLQYAYMWNVRRVLGADHPLGEIELRTHTANYAFSRLNGDQFVAYSYLLDMRNQPVRAASTKTFGVRYRGSAGDGSTRLLYLAEYADQSGFADGADTNEATYYRLDVGIKFANEWSLTGSREQLGGDGIYGFQTQMATLHAFNGTADLFLRTPSEGLVDDNIKLYAPLWGTRVDVAYHRFNADNGNADYGREWDMSIVGKLNQRMELGVKFADYQAEGFGRDTTRIWAWVRLSLEP